MKEKTVVREEDLKIGQIVPEGTIVIPLSLFCFKRSCASLRVSKCGPLNNDAWFIYKPSVHHTPKR